MHELRFRFFVQNNTTVTVKKLPKNATLGEIRNRLANIINDDAYLCAKITNGQKGTTEGGCFRIIYAGVELKNEDEQVIIKRNLDQGSIVHVIYERPEQEMSNDYEEISKVFNKT